MTTIGYLWETPTKPGEKHIRRQVLGHRTFDSVVITPRPPEDLSTYPGSVVGLGRRRKNPLRRAIRKHILHLPRAEYDGSADVVRRVLADQSVDLLHVFFGHKGADYSGLISNLRIPVTVSFHGVDVGWCEHKPELRQRMPALFDLAACVMVRSEFMRRSVIDLGCPAERTWVHRTGIPLEDFPYVDRHRDPSGGVTFLQVGRLIEKKGIGDTIRAFAEVSSRVPGARLWLAGDGPLRSNLEAEVRDHGLTGSVEFLGFLGPEELLVRLRDADVYVHPSVTAGGSDREGIPNSMLEAMATGLAPVSTRHAGIPEVIDDGVHGWLVDEGDFRALAARMLWCAGHRDEVADVGRRARARVEEAHGLESRMSALETKFAEILANHGAEV